MEGVAASEAAREAAIAKAGNIRIGSLLVLLAKEQLGAVSVDHVVTSCLEDDVTLLCEPRCHTM
jgi:hypothetical protein